MAKQCYCFLERFNNYFNRKLIKYDALEDYQNNSQSSFIPIDDNGRMLPFDFNPNDNITTEIIANDVPFDPDYFLLLDDEENIVSRWFVLEQKRNRKGQWLYFLKRDVLADSYNNLINAPVYVEKGIINDISSPLLLNNENLIVNQIKKEEILLKDATECPWLILYLKKGALGNSTIGPDGDGTVTINVPNPDAYYFEKLTTPFASWQYYQYATNDFKVNTKTKINFRVNVTVFPTWLFSYSITNTSPDYPSSVSAQIPLGSWLDSGLNTEKSNETVKGLLDAYMKNFTVMSDLTTKVNSAYGYNGSNPLLIYDGKIILDSLGKYYKITVRKVSSSSQTTFVTSAGAPTLKNTLTNIWNNALSESDSPQDKAFEVVIDYESWRISYEEVDGFNVKAYLKNYTGKGTIDSPLFDALCMPYGKVKFTNPSDLLHHPTSSADRSMAVMSSIARALTDQWVLDLQLLPYCPLQQFIMSGQTEPTMLVLDTANASVLANSGGASTDVMLVADYANFTLDIEKKILINDTSNVPDVYKAKYVNDCTTVRLCSPNYNGIFEFNLAKNGGNVEKFNVDITLRPFNPYIHLNPNFNFIYGSDFNDVRGLICGGDFSLGIINDAWNVYEIQNKNYQAIFDRQIQNLDVNNKINLSEAWAGAGAGTVQGTAGGAVTGGMAGGPWGALAGAVVGGATSFAGGLIDVSNVKARQAEARNFAIDNFNLSLGNIKALPYSITKTSALTYNNKLFPFVEIYECSEVEKEAYYNKIKYNGMNVNIIDYMKNYASQNAENYFRAKLIRFTDISEDNHYVETINEELLKGVFI